MEKHSHLKLVGARLRMTIRALNLRQADIVRQFPDLSAQKLGNWIRGDHYPDPWFIYRFCSSYTVSQDWIWHGKTSSMARDLADVICALQQRKAEGKPVQKLESKKGKSNARETEFDSVRLR